MTDEKQYAEETYAYYDKRLKNLEIETGFKGSMTVCDMQRKIWQITHDDKMTNMTEEGKVELEHYLERAFLMAKKMNAKLRQYKYNYDDGWYAEERKKEKLWIEELRNDTPNYDDINA